MGYWRYVVVDLRSVIDTAELHAGSGSTYVYGYCDATFQDGWGRDETVKFVKNSELLLSSCQQASFLIPLVSALSLAMSRDGSSGGVIRMCVITEDNVERLFVPGDQLPKFWEGREVLGAASNKTVDDVVPMAVEA